MAKKPVRKLVPVDELVLDAGTQSRVAISEETVEQYIAVLEQAKANDSPWPFPDLDVFRNGDSALLMASGAHRTLAARRAGWEEVPCIIHEGDAWAAFEFGMQANFTHGLRHNSADRHYCVCRMLDSGRPYTQQEIANKAGVSLRTVQRIVAERAPKPPMAGSGDPFDVEDPFGVSGSGEEDGTDSGDHDDQELPPPDANGNGRETSEGPSRTPAEEFKLQKAKTVKTAEALGRAFGDLHQLKKSQYLEATIASVEALIEQARSWPK